MSDTPNRGCTNHGCVYHYVYPELAKGMHTNGPCHCKARPIADYLHRENIKLKAELGKLKEWQKIVLGTGTDQEAVIRMAATEYTKVAVQSWRDEVDKLKAKLATAKEREARTVGVLNNLHGLVWGECPSLLNEDSGGDGKLDAEIRAVFREEAGT